MEGNQVGKFNGFLIILRIKRAFGTKNWKNFC